MALPLGPRTHRRRKSEVLVILVELLHHMKAVVGDKQMVGVVDGQADDRLEMGFGALRINSTSSFSVLKTKTAPTLVSATSSNPLESTATPLGV